MAVPARTKNIQVVQDESAPKDFLAYKGINILDFAIVTHIHEDHICGLEQFISAGGLVKKLFTVKILPQDVPKLFSSNISAPGIRKFVSALNSYRLLLILLEKQKTVTVEVDASFGGISLAEGLFAEIIAPSTERANFTDAIDITVNTLCHAPHSAVVITIL